MTTTIEMTFSAGWSVDLNDVLEELNIERQDIEDMHIKYCVIHVEMKDGRELQYDTCAYEAELDTKYPAAIYLFDDNKCIASATGYNGSVPSYRPLSTCMY